MAARIWAGYNGAMSPRLPKPLTKKRNALLYEQQQLLARAKQIDADLHSIDFVIRLIAPGWKPPRKATRPGTPRRLPKGEISATCLRLLRKRPGMSSADLADLARKECDLSFTSKTEKEDFASAVAMAMRRYERRGLLEITGKNRTTGALHWRIRDANSSTDRLM